MYFVEPIDKQPMRIIEDNHICKDLGEFCLWTQLDYQTCLASLRLQNGEAHIQLGAWHVEPYYPERKSRKRPIRIINKNNGEVTEFESLFDASCKLGIPESNLRGAMHNQGPWRENIRVQRM